MLPIIPEKNRWKDKNSFLTWKHHGFVQATPHYFPYGLYLTTARRQSPPLSASRAFVWAATPSNLCVMKWSTQISPFSALSTSIGIASRVFHPPHVLCVAH